MLLTVSINDLNDHSLGI